MLDKILFLLPILIFNILIKKNIKHKILLNLLYLLIGFSTYYGIIKEGYRKDIIILFLISLVIESLWLYEYYNSKIKFEHFTH